MKTFIAVPAVTLILLVGVFSQVNEYLKPNNPPEITQQTFIINENEEELFPGGEDFSEELIHYVLDSVKPGEAEMGIFLNAQNTPLPTTSTNPDLKLVSF